VRTKAGRCREVTLCSDHTPLTLGQVALSPQMPPPLLLVSMPSKDTRAQCSFLQRLPLLWWVGPPWHGGELFSPPRSPGKERGGAEGRS
jgi:hypothetical protein